MINEILYIDKQKYLSTNSTDPIVVKTTYGNNIVVVTITVQEDLAELTYNLQLFTEDETLVFSETKNLENLKSGSTHLLTFEVDSGIIAKVTSSTGSYTFTRNVSVSVGSTDCTVSGDRIDGNKLPGNPIQPVAPLSKGVKINIDFGYILIIVILIIVIIIIASKLKKKNK